MEKNRFEWSQILRVGRIVVGPLVLFIAIAIPLSPADTTLASAGSTIPRGDQQRASLTLISPGFAMQNAEDGTVEVSNQLATYLQVVLVVIVCLLLLSATVYFSMSWGRKTPLPTPVVVKPVVLITPEPQPDPNNGTHTNNPVHGGVKQTHDEQIQDTEEIPVPVSISIPHPPDARIDKIEAAARKYMRVYCPVHRVGFSVSRSGRDIRCNHDHLVASNFPGADWVFCCDCRRFSLASNSEESGSKTCPCCERRMVRMYLCNQCHVLSAQSRTLDLENHMIKDDGIWPSCPSCISRPPEQLWNHQCAVMEAELMSVFQPCQWCEQLPPDRRNGRS